MPTSPRSERKAAAGAKPKQPPRRHPILKLDSMMACDAAFRIIARRYLTELTANHAATCRGDPEALHQMRIALTRLRTAILFFSPMVVDIEQLRIKRELKWLNTHLGIVRDLDVAIDRLQAARKERPQAKSDYRSWRVKRANSHRGLTRALRSARYRSLARAVADWIEAGPWSTKKGKQAGKERASSIASYSADKLARWQQELLKKSRKLRKMGPKKRHRLRLLNKKLTYSVELLEDLLAGSRHSKQRTALKHLRKAQRCLGQLNDDVRGHALAAALHRDGIDAPLQFLSLKREKRLIRAAATAYEKLAAQKVWAGPGSRYWRT
jgi:CHAD domain-containing protein